MAQRDEELKARIAQLKASLSGRRARLRERLSESFSRIQTVTAQELRSQAKAGIVLMIGSFVMWGCVATVAIWMVPANPVGAAIGLSLFAWTACTGAITWKVALLRAEIADLRAKVEALAKTESQEGASD